MMRPCETCGKPTADSLAICDHTEELRSLRQRAEDLERWKTEAMHVLAPMQEAAQIAGLVWGDNISTKLAEHVVDLRAKLAAVEQELDALRADGERLRDALNGVLWMFDEGHIVRSIAHDAEPDYAPRAMRFVMWIKSLDAARAAERKKGEGDAE